MNINKNRSTRSRDICLCAVFAALAAVGAFIKVPMPVCPFTLQLMFTTLAGLLLGKRLGAISIAIYVIIGLLGVPVFTQGGGIGYVLQPTFGYLVAFILGTYATGAIAEKGEPTFKRLWVASLVGLVIVYVIGMVYLYIICNYVLGSTQTVSAVLMSCFVFVIPGDFALSILAAYIAKRLIPILIRQNIGIGSAKTAQLQTKEAEI